MNSLNYFINFHSSFSQSITLFCTWLLILHFSWAGYWFLTKAKKINFATLILGTLTVVDSFLLFSSYQNLFLWLICLINILICVMVFHQYYKTIVTQEYLKEYINFKFYIEVIGISWSILGLISLHFFKANENILTLMMLVIFLRLNWIIILKKKVYSIEYPNSQLSDEPLMSLVIIALNEEKYISNLLESIKKLSYKKIEVIFVDDASTDKTVEVVKIFEKFFPLQIKIKEKSQRGVSRSRNLGAKFASGELITFLDSDVLLPVDFVENCIAEFSNKHLAITGADFDPINTVPNDKIVIAVYRFWINTVQYFFPRVIGSCIVVRKDLHDKILFDEEVIQAEDFDYARRGSQIGKFRILKSKPVNISWRRFRNENPIILIIKYLAFEIYRNTIGEIKKPILPYNFEDNHR